MKKKINSKLETVSVGSVVVRIYRRDRIKNGKVYRTHEIADHTSGIRRLRSFSDHAQALKEAEKIARQLSTGQATAATMRNSEAAAYGHSVQILRPTRMSLISAASRCAEAFKILGGDRIIEAAKDFARRNPVKRQPRTVRQVADEIIQLQNKRAKSARYIEDLRGRLGAFAKAFAQDIANVATADLQTWFDGMKASPRSVKNFRGAVNSLFKFAEARGYVARGENPVTATQRIATRNGEPISIYTPSEMHRLLLAAPERFKPVIALQGFAGLRSAEVMRLDWRDVKLSRGHIELGADKSKTATRRLVPISANLAEWLAPHALKSGPVFRHTRAYFHEVQHDTAAATGIKTDVKKNQAAVAPVEWKHNALRHSFISYRVASIQNVAQVALEAGNSPAMIFGHYRELVTADEAKAWFAITPERAANVLPMAAVGVEK